jgi:Tfp pilus assembly protein PilO
VIIYTDGSWPLWLRALITLFAAALVAVMGWQYYKRYWRR